MSMVIFWLWIPFWLEQARDCQIIRLQQVAVVRQIPMIVIVAAKAVYTPNLCILIVGHSSIPFFVCFIKIDLVSKETRVQHCEDEAPILR